MRYEVRSNYYDGEGRWRYIETYLESDDFEEAKKRFFQVINYKSPLNAIWIEFSLLGIDELGQIITFIELRKRSNI